MPGLACAEQQRAEVVLAVDRDAAHRAEQVVARRAFAHAFGEDLADDVAGGHAEPGITLDEERVGPPREAADLREQVGAASHRPTPGEVDADVLQVGEDLQHQLAVPGLEVAGNAFDEGRGGAEQQAVLVGHPVVVDDRADVAVGAADRADPLDQFVR